MGGRRWNGPAMMRLYLRGGAVIEARVEKWRPGPEADGGGRLGYEWCDAEDRDLYVHDWSEVVATEFVQDRLLGLAPPPGS